MVLFQHFLLNCCLCCCCSACGSSCCHPLHHQHCRHHCHSQPPLLVVLLFVLLLFGTTECQHLGCHLVGRRQDFASEHAGIWDCLYVLLIFGCACSYYRTSTLGSTPSLYDIEGVYDEKYSYIIERVHRGCSLTTAKRAPPRFWIRVS